MRALANRKKIRIAGLSVVAILSAILAWQWRSGIEIKPPQKVLTRISAMDQALQRESVMHPPASRHLRAGSYRNTMVLFGVIGWTIGFLLLGALLLLQRPWAKTFLGRLGINRSRGIQLLERELSGAVHRLQALDQAISEQADLNQKLIEERAAWETQLKAARQQWQQCQGSLDAERRQREGSAQTVAALQTALTSVESREKTLKTKCSELETRLKEVDKTIAHQSSGLKAYEEASAPLHHALSQAQMKIEAHQHKEQEQQQALHI
ncbi:MAG: hypothetical protein HYT88_07250, partial [Candidatus Omnitrophica bacterium]|nr:hypothetical protein [Candidatus Omnitrophota bacterium]